MKKRLLFILFIVFFPSLLLLGLFFKWKDSYEPDSTRQQASPEAGTGAAASSDSHKGNKETLSESRLEQKPENHPEYESENKSENKPENKSDNDLNNDLENESENKSNHDLNNTPESESKNKSEKHPDDGWEAEKETVIRKPVQVTGIDFARLSDREIQITWPDKTNPYADGYRIKKRAGAQSAWQVIGTQASDGSASGRELSFIDVLDSPLPQQYEYRVDIKPADDSLYRAVRGTSVYASNILLCLDPGHYEGQNQFISDGVSYCEGDFTLELALQLKQILKKTYGVTAYLTRESSSISLDGYVNAELDNGHISLRGAYARGSTLFLSLHTNANQEGANGYSTLSQPIEITKPIIIANTAALDSGYALAVGSAVGMRLADASFRLGIAVPDKFQPVESRYDVIPWTDAFNDGLDSPGTICCRMGEHGDYYGVLRGAAEAGVPGMIIEHGFHTVPRMRMLAAEGNLQIQWAKADADGIAEGFGLSNTKED